ncbi:MAG: long-chain-acyl-CoA synthetase [Deltaproteobacteria bacterium]|nr:long-chain-acyl-CoA synthetase [Deltaproteobacteria bacterium]
MDATGLEKDEAKIIKFSDFLPYVLKYLPKVPSTIKAVGQAKKMSSDTKMSLGIIFEENAVKYADTPAVKYEDVVYSHKEFNQIVNRYAHFMLSLGIKKGETVIAFLENRPEILFIIGAVAKIGAVVSLINPHQRGAVLIHSVGLAPSKHFIIGEELVDAFEEVKPELNLGDDVRFYYLEDLGASGAPAGYQDWGTATKDCDSQNPPTTADITMEDPFAYLFTSGTTGMPKAAITLQGKWVTTYLTFGKIMLKPTSEDTVYIPLPFYHGTAMYVGWPAASSGGAAIAIRRKFSVSNFWPDVKKFNATGFIYIGELCRYLMEQPPSPDDSNNTITKIIGNGLRVDMWKAFKSRFDIPFIYEFYGASEGNIAFLNMLNMDCTVGVCLLPFAIVKYDIEAEAPIRDENGFMQRVETGEAGLLLGEISEETPFVGYTDEEETENKIFRDVFEKGDAWFDTGDLLRDIGFKHAQFVDRLGDTFRWKGENVSTLQVEAAVNSFHQISESAVYGASIPGTDGRAGMTAIIPYEPPDKFDLAGFYSALASKLPNYAIPAFIRLKTEFDYTETMKLKKGKLKKEGFDLSQVSDPLYVCLPGSKEYIALTDEIFKKITNKEYRF